MLPSHSGPSPLKGKGCALGLRTASAKVGLLSVLTICVTLRFNFADRALASRLTLLSPTTTHRLPRATATLTRPTPRPTRPSPTPTRLSLPLPRLPRWSNQRRRRRRSSPSTAPRSSLRSRTGRGRVEPWCQTQRSSSFLTHRLPRLLLR